MKNRLMILMACAMCIVIPTPVSAGNFEKAVDGLNGIVTAAFDPIVGLVVGAKETYPAEELQDFGMLNPVVHRVEGVVYGAIVAVIRITTGVLDLMTSPFDYFGVLSPPARVRIFELERVEENYVTGPPS